MKRSVKKNEVGISKTAVPGARPSICAETPFRLPQAVLERKKQWAVI